jgi:glycosyltransferase involved in cell wall biosynthesis
MFRIGFIIEQVLGHTTHAKNLQNHLLSVDDIIAHWEFPVWKISGIKKIIPVYGQNWTVRASFHASRAITNWKRNNMVDGLFFHTQVPAIFNQSWMAQIPSIISLDATPRQYDRLGTFYEHATGPSWLENKKWELNVAAFQAARHLVSWSEWAKAGLVAEYRVPAEKVTVIPPGVDSAVWQRPSPRPTTPQRPLQILFVGGNLQRKGGLDLLAAFQRLQQTLPAAAPPIELHLVTRDSVDPAPGVHAYHDMQPNSPPLIQLFHDSDIFCLPTHGDCLPMVLAEAGAAGLPMISTNVAAIPEIVRHEQTGLIIPPQDVAALTDALARLILQPELRLQYGRQAKKCVQSEHDAPHNAAKLLTLLKQIIDERH